MTCSNFARLLKYAYFEEPPGRSFEGWQYTLSFFSEAKGVGQGNAHIEKDKSMVKDNLKLTADGWRKFGGWIWKIGEDGEMLEKIAEISCKYFSTWILYYQIYNIFLYKFQGKNTHFLRRSYSFQPLRNKLISHKNTKKSRKQF